MGINWTRWFKDPPIVIDGYKYTQEGVPLCACKHARNEHIGVCWKMFCACTNFTQARVMNE